MPDRLGRVRGGAHAAAARARNTARRAIRCRRGAYAVEFAMVASSLLLMLLGAVEMAWQGLTAVAMENATLQVSRTGSLGCLQNDGSRAGQAGQEELKAVARAAGGGLLTRDTLALTTSVFSNVSNVNADPKGGTAGAAGVGGQTVLYTLTYKQPYLFAGGLLKRDHYTHTGTFVIKNEPFANGGGSAKTCS